MFISQPALSESIKRLKEDLGCTLLHRSKTGITFTEDGKMVLEQALRILEHHDQIRHNLQIKYDQEHIYGKLVFGVGPTINDTFLPDLLLKMHQLHPHISLSVLATTFDAMSTLLTNGIIDVGLAGIHQTEALAFAQTYVQNDHIFYVEKLFTDPMVCVM
jgi:DNA-binding transcriptional LysR family regulator